MFVLVCVSLFVFASAKLMVVWFACLAGCSFARLCVRVHVCQCVHVRVLCVFVRVLLGLRCSLMCAVACLFACVCLSARSVVRVCCLSVCLFGFSCV